MNYLLIAIITILFLIAFLILILAGFTKLSKNKHVMEAIDSFKKTAPKTISSISLSAKEVGKDINNFEKRTIIIVLFALISLAAFYFTVRLVHFFWVTDLTTMQKYISDLLKK